MILGLVAVKQNSNRFPGKNFALVDGKPLFWHAVEPLRDCELIDDLYVVTDSLDVLEYCKQRDVRTIWRAKNAARDNDKLINVLRFGYYHLSIEYDIIVSVMANCLGHKVEDVKDAIEVLKTGNLREVRSFDSLGHENGILVFSKEIMEDNRDISYYIGGVLSDGREIHFEKDLDSQETDHRRNQ